MTQRVIAVGATGHIGRPLCDTLIEAGHEVVVFSRDPDRARDVVPGAAGYVAWQPDVLPEPCVRELASADAVVYLAGGTLFDGKPHSQADVEAETNARAFAMGRIVAAIGRLEHRPSVFVAASSVGYYGYAVPDDTRIDEDHPVGADWWGRGSAVIEDAATAVRAHGVRAVLLRTGYAITRDTLAGQLAPFQRHLGGWIGNGRGWTPWIHMADEVGIIRHLLEDPSADGAYNLTAPEPLRAKDFARVLGRVVGRRAWLPTPTPLVRMGMGVVTDILVRGQRVVPARVSASGYSFLFAEAESALRDMVGAQGRTSPKRISSP